VLGCLFNLQPSSKGVTKLVAQINNLCLNYPIGMTGLQQGLKRVVDHLEVDLAQFTLFHGSTPYKTSLHLSTLGAVGDLQIGHSTVMKRRLGQSHNSLNGGSLGHGGMELRLAAPPDADTLVPAAPLVEAPVDDRPDP
jgi:hypothetical protein